MTAQSKQCVAAVGIGDRGHLWRAWSRTALPCDDDTEAPEFRPLW